MSDILDGLNMRIGLCMATKLEIAAADKIEQLQARVDKLSEKNKLLLACWNQSEDRVDKLEAVEDAAEEAQRWIHPEAPGWVEEDLRKSLVALEEQSNE